MISIKVCFWNWIYSDYSAICLSKFLPNISKNLLLTFLRVPMTASASQFSVKYWMKMGEFLTWWWLLSMRNLIQLQRFCSKKLWKSIMWVYNFTVSSCHIVSEITTLLLIAQHTQTNFRTQKMIMTSMWITLLFTVDPSTFSSSLLLNLSCFHCWKSCLGVMGRWKKIVSLSRHAPISNFLQLTMIWFSVSLTPIFICLELKTLQFQSVHFIIFELLVWFVTYFSNYCAVFGCIPKTTPAFFFASYFQNKLKFFQLSKLNKNVHKTRDRYKITLMKARGHRNVFYCYYFYCLLDNNWNPR